MGYENNKRDYVSQEKLIRSLPLNEWFTKECCDVDMEKASFNRKLKSFPVELLQRKNHARGIRFKLNSENLPALLLFEPKTPGAKKGVKKVDWSKTQKHELSIADICQNIAEGMKVRNVLPKGV